MLEFIDKMMHDVDYRNHIIKYLFFGVFTTIICLGSFWLMRKFLPFLNENIANIISIILAVIVAYITNRKYVFTSTETNVMKEFLTFCSGRAFTMVFETVSFWLFATMLHFPEMLVKIVVSVVVVILNYIISKLFVFKKKNNV